MGASSLDIQRRARSPETDLVPLNECRVLGGGGQLSNRTAVKARRCAPERYLRIASERLIKGKGSEMAENSKIEWTDHTFNPWIGCQKVSPGCDNCYAEALMDKRYGKVQWGPHGERKRTSEANWKLPLRWAKAARGTGRRPRVFCASLADWLDNKVPQEWREDLARLIAATPELDWLLLTKRIELFSRLSPWPLSVPGGQLGFPSNVWLGTTAENQEQAERRGRILRQAMLAEAGVDFEAIPARYRLGSFVRREVAERLLSDDELARIPERHRPTGPVMRTNMVVVDMPPFNTVRNRVEVIFDGAEAL